MAMPTSSTRRWQNLWQATALSGLLGLLSLLSSPSVAGAAEESGRLAPCPAKPNCVSSQATETEQKVAPLRYSDDPTAAQNRLLAVLTTLPSAKVTRNKPGLVDVEFRSRLFGFIDDVTFVFDPAGAIQLRSASRLGYYDFGVNRERVDVLRSRFEASGENLAR